MLTISIIRKKLPMHILGCWIHYINIKKHAQVESTNWAFEQNIYFPLLHEAFPILLSKFPRSLLAACTLTIGLCVCVCLWVCSSTGGL